MSRISLPIERPNGAVIGTMEFFIVDDKLVLPIGKIAYTFNREETAKLRDFLNKNYSGVDAD